MAPEHLRRPFPNYRGQTDAEMAAWLRQILANHLANAVRDFGRDKRDVGREQSIQADLNHSSFRLDAWLAAEQTSPSQRTIRTEQGIALAAALAELPDAQREAVTLHHLTVDAIQQMVRQSGECVSFERQRSLLESVYE